MNHIIISNFADLLKILEEPIYLSGKSSIDDETAHNMWALTFSDSLISKIEVKNLENFLTRLLQKRTLQLRQIDPSKSATFYLWFDKQALQLRFNIISGTNQTLPFGCKLNIIHPSQRILKDFVSKVRDIADYGESIEFLKPDECLDDDQQEYILDVYVEEINQIYELS